VLIINWSCYIMKILKLNKSVLSKVASSITMVALVLVTSFGPQLVEALANTASKDTSTRTQIGVTADHTIVFTLPATIDFDSTTQTDAIHIDFPASFTLGGTWVAGDFTLNDGTPRTSVTPSQGAGTIDCTVAAGVNNFCVAIDTTNNIFTIKPSATWTAQSTAATITFGIDGTSTDGTLTNPGSVAATNIDFQVCDEVAACLSAFTTSHSSQIAYGVIDDDTVAITASVNSSITFDLDTAGSNDSTCDVDETATPYEIALGSITSADTRISGATDTVNLICVDLDTNASGGAIVTINNANGASGLVSTSTPADDIDSNDGVAVTAGTENYGLCIVTATASTGTLDDEGGYDGDTCAANSATNVVQSMSAVTPETIFDTNSAPIAGGRGTIAVNASVTVGQASHNDYTDALTFIATATF
jgi:hypothetical protein